MIGFTRLVLLGAVALSGGACSILPFNSHVNQEAPPTGVLERSIGEEEQVPSGAEVASESVPWDMDLDCRNKLVVSIEQGRFERRADCGRGDTYHVAVALSGGGSRASIFSAEVFFELQRYGLLEKVDVISSVSGGSYTAALYALSCDPLDIRPGQTCPDTVEGPKRMPWTPEEVFPLLERNFIARWIGNWFWPENIVRYWLTKFDRTDVMAETLADNLFDRSLLGGEGFRMQDLNPQRPNLIINATNNTFVDLDTNLKRHAAQLPDSERKRKTRLNFTFTRETFAELRSNLDRYPVANAVAASSAFPGAFQYVTLKDYAKTDGDSYVHIFDGGTSDNLGLEAIDRIIAKLPPQALDNLLVILIDAYIPSVGKEATEAEPRSGVDYIVDTNFLDAFDTLMTKLRDEKLRSTTRRLRRPQDFVHFTFRDLRFRHPDVFGIVSKIKTDLAIDERDAVCLRVAARLLVEGKIAGIRRNHSGLGVLTNDGAKPRAKQMTCDTSPRESTWNETSTEE